MDAASPVAAPAVSVRDLIKRFPRTLALAGISFDLRRGEILCIVGESGSGKSMSANAIMGLLPPGLVPQSGRILFQGRDLLLRNVDRHTARWREDLLGEKASSDFWILMRAWNYAARNEFRPRT